MRTLLNIFCAPIKLLLVFITAPVAILLLLSGLDDKADDLLDWTLTPWF